MFTSHPEYADMVFVYITVQGCSVSECLIPGHWPEYLFTCQKQNFCFKQTSFWFLKLFGSSLADGNLKLFASHWLNL